MKQILKISMLALVLVLSACNQKRPAQRIASRDTVRGPVDQIGGQDPKNIYNSCGSKCTWGKFFEPSSSDFEDRVRRFGSVSVPIEEIGSVDYTFNGTETGVWFWGDIALQGGNLRTLMTGATSTNLSISTNSKMAVVIYDSFSLDQQVSPIASLFTGSSGGQAQGALVRNGNQIHGEFRFQDQWGSITLIGDIAFPQGTADLSQATFEGEAKFDNRCSMNPEQGTCTGPSLASQETRLGKFSVAACGFFGCE